MKRLIVSLICAILLIGCNNRDEIISTNRVDDSNELKEEVKLLDGENDNIQDIKAIRSDDLHDTSKIIYYEVSWYLGMPLVDAKNELEDLGLSSSELLITHAPNEKDIGNSQILNSTFNMYFDENDELYNIDFRDRKQSNDKNTSLGLKYGDSFETMKSIYGSNFSMYETSSFIICEYSLNNSYLYVLHNQAGRIEGWGISKYPYSRYVYSYEIIENIDFDMKSTVSIEDVLKDRVIVDEINNKLGVLSLEMTYEEIISWLRKHNISYNEMDFGVLEVASSDEYEEFTLGFLFDRHADNDLFYIDVWGRDIPTSLGLRTGDSVDTMIKLYGSNYKIWLPDNPKSIYEYYFENIYFRVMIEDDMVVSWIVSKYRFDEILKMYES